MRTLPMGDRACLVEDLPVTPAAWATGLSTLAIAGIVDVVPAARTVLVRCDDAEALTAAIARFDEVAGATIDADAAVESVTIPVRYGGPDLVEVGARTGLTIEEVVAAHTGAEYRVAFCGFAPGFAYLTGLPIELELPRRATPRTQVPAGSVAIAAAYSAVYPSESPGGWHLLGSTSMALWDLRAEPPARLTPGTIVRFEAR